MILFQKTFCDYNNQNDENYDEYDNFNKCVDTKNVTQVNICTHFAAR